MMEAAVYAAEPWRSFNPLESDWLCDKCGIEQQGLPAVCGQCLQPRILDTDEQEQLEAAQRTGELLCKDVILAEALPQNIGSEIDSVDKSLRDWNGARTQRLKLNGQTKFLLLAFPADDEEEDDEAQMKAKSMIEQRLANFCKLPKVFTFKEKKKLNEITEVIMKKEFQSQEDEH